MKKYEIVVIGGGVVGLAIGRKFAMMGKKVLILEAREQIGLETSFRNSAVIHAGIYYPSNSLKAKLCREGRDKLYQYCQKRNVAHRKIGKMITATDKGQLSKLEQLKQQALLNGVDDIQILKEKQIQSLEPNILAVEALYSPSTGIINGKELMHAYKDDIESYGGTIQCNSKVKYGAINSDGFVISLENHNDELQCECLINAGGLWAQSISSLISGIPIVSIPKCYYAKGSYFKLVKLEAPISHLIYPIPEQAGLGIHATIDVMGNIFFGPDVEWVENLDFTVDVKRKKLFLEKIQTYLPMIQDDNLIPVFAGVRPKTLPEGEQPQDFEIQFTQTHGIKNLVCLYGIESPGLTSSLAIADYVHDKI